MGARLQRNVEVGAARIRPGGAERLRLRVGAAWRLRPPLADDAPALHENGADGRIGARRPDGEAGEFDRPLHRVYCGHRVVPGPSRVLRRAWPQV